jgi:hypothetical protein
MTRIAITQIAVDGSPDFAPIAFARSNDYVNAPVALNSRKGESGRADAVLGLPVRGRLAALTRGIIAKSRVRAQTLMGRVRHLHRN